MVSKQKQSIRFPWGACWVITNQTLAEAPHPTPTRHPPPTAPPSPKCKVVRFVKAAECASVTISLQTGLLLNTLFKWKHCRQSGECQQTQNKLGSFLYFVLWWCRLCSDSCCTTACRLKVRFLFYVSRACVCHSCGVILLNLFCSD